MGRFAIAAALCLACLIPLSAQEEELFGEEETVETSVEAAAPQEEFLVYETPRVGGSIDGGLDFAWAWLDPWNSFDIGSPSTQGLVPSLSGSLSLTAKPDKAFGAFGEARFSYPFVRSATASASGETSIDVPSISIWKLYSKFSWNEALFLQFGKQSIRWGTGRFYSPADDLFASGEIDPLDPDAEREGPLALKAQFPVPGTMHNLYAYAVFPSSSILAEDIVGAAKAEFWLPGVEMALGGYYAKDEPARGLFLFSAGLGRINFFGEAVVKFGSSKVFLYKTESPTTVFGHEFLYRTEKRETTPFFTGTIGGYWSQEEWNLAISAQYIFDGEAYSNGLRLADAAAAVLDQALPFNPNPDDPKLVSGSGDYSNLEDWYAHHAIIVVSKSELFIEDLSAALIVRLNVGDFSGVVTPSVSWTLFDYSVISAGASFSFGDDGDEYTGFSSLADFAARLADPDHVSKPYMALSLSLTLGAGTY